MVDCCYVYLIVLVICSERLLSLIVITDWFDLMAILFCLLFVGLLLVWVGSCCRLLVVWDTLVVAYAPGLFAFVVCLF